MEAASVAWHHMGWQAVGFSEIEPFPSAILAHRFPNTKNYGDLTKYQQWPIEPGTTDILVGGTPCQSFSVAGLRKGLQDPRGNLALTFLGLADKIKPQWIIWKNVPGVLSSSGGRDFGSFLAALGELGYGYAYRVLDAQYFGVPQRRRRIFVVAYLGDWRPPAEVLFESDCLCWDTEKGRKKRKAVTASVEASVGTEDTIWSAGDQANAERYINKAGTLNCNKGQRGGWIAPVNPVVIDRAAFNQGANAQYEPHIEQTDVMDSPVARGPHAVGQPIAIQGTIIGRNENAGPQGKGTNEDGTMFTLTKTDIHAVGQPIELTQTDMAVRRLTPVECERLQGFPDNWSQIPWKNKPAEQCPDGPRYKACGNSMAVPVMRWIGERIQLVVDRYK
jgi:DNA (cytosine-5)-methyltransferase 1